jgi:hypothetical protein
MWRKKRFDLAVIGGAKDDKALKSYQVVHFQPFDPVHDALYRRSRKKRSTMFSQEELVGTQCT